MSESQSKKSKTRFVTSSLNSTEQKRLAQAQEFVYDAWEWEDSNVAVELATKAIDHSPYCADAILFLSKIQDQSAEERLFSLVLAMNAGAMAIGKQFEDLIGSFWGVLKTRPFMRALAAHAESLQELTGYEAAILDYQFMLQLNPNDNQGVRYELLPLLVEQQWIDVARALLKSYPDDSCVVWVFMDILLDFIKDQKQAESTFIRYSQKHVVAVDAMFELLTERKKFKPLNKDQYSSCSEEEAHAYYPSVADAWKSIEGAIDWLKIQKL